ncbi:hypothetical protein [Streptomyces sp. NPDC006997]|uniref:hypothetical protein n=1 Tax=Streptomyces sp. NPDC006997 TaxID=3155356 RepID=UPI0033D8DAE2
MSGLDSARNTVGREAVTALATAAPRLPGARPLPRHGTPPTARLQTGQSPAPGS